MEEIEKEIDYLLTTKEELRQENKELEARIDKAIEITRELIMNSADNRLIAEKEEMEYFDYLDEKLEAQYKILKGEELK